MTIFLAGVFRNKNTVTGAAAGFVIISYFLNVLGEAASGVASEVARLSLFHYYDHLGVMMHGVSLINITGLLVLTVALVAGGIWAFQRRDVGI
jgi:putative exporter of polyketide antibiotics